MQSVLIPLAYPWQVETLFAMGGWLLLWTCDSCPDAEPHTIRELVRSERVWLRAKQPKHDTGNPGLLPALPLPAI
jgi:hypothetical protein